MERKELLNADEAASRLNVTRRTLLRWARESEIESVRISRKVILFSEEAIKDFVTTRTNGVQFKTTHEFHRGESSPHRKSEKGGGRRTSGELWNDLRKEVRQWQ
jgi:excisionase family DNA binding protein